MLGDPFRITDIFDAVFRPRRLTGSPVTIRP
jgi:hypothetical protein